MIVTINYTSHGNRSQRPSVHGRCTPGFGTLRVPLFHRAAWDGSKSLVWAAALPMSSSLAAPAAPREEPPGPQQLWCGWWKQDPRAMEKPGWCEDELVPPGLCHWFLQKLVGGQWSSSFWKELVTDPNITSTPLTSAHKWQVKPASLGFSTFSECRQ